MKIHRIVIVYEDGYRQTLESPNLENVCDMMLFYIEQAKGSGNAVKDVICGEYEA